jgi:hypothetical protein
MLNKNKFHFVAALLAGASLLAGCAGADPASEEPVSLKGGAYRITLSGGMAKGDELETLCVIPGHDEGNVSQLAEKYLSFGGECSHNAKDRVGNAISGTVTCPWEGAGSTVIEYQGAIGTEAIIMEGTVAINLPDDRSSIGDAEAIAQQERVKSNMDGVVLTLKAERTGECS